MDSSPRTRSRERLGVDAPVPVKERRGGQFIEDDEEDRRVRLPGRRGNGRRIAEDVGGRRRREKRTVNSSGAIAAYVKKRRTAVERHSKMPTPAATTPRAPKSLAPRPGLRLGGLLGDEDAGEEPNDDVVHDRPDAHAEDPRCRGDRRDTRSPAQAHGNAKRTTSIRLAPSSRKVSGDRPNTSSKGHVKTNPHAAKSWRKRPRLLRKGGTGAGAGRRSSTGAARWSCRSPKVAPDWCTLLDRAPIDAALRCTSVSRVS